MTSDLMCHCLGLYVSTLFVYSNHIQCIFPFHTKQNKSLFDTHHKYIGLDIFWKKSKFNFWLLNKWSYSNCIRNLYTNWNLCTSYLIRHIKVDLYQIFRSCRTLNLIVIIRLCLKFISLTCKNALVLMQIRPCISYWSISYVYVIAMVTNETNSLTSGEGKMQLSTCMIEMKDDKIVIL